MSIFNLNGFESVKRCRIEPLADSRLIPYQEEQRVEMFGSEPPSTSYQTELAQTLFGTKKWGPVLTYREPQFYQPSIRSDQIPYEAPQEASTSQPIWEIQKRPGRVIKLPPRFQITDFHLHPIDWGNTLYYGCMKKIHALNDMLKSPSKPFIFAFTKEDICSLKSSIEQTKIAVGHFFGLFSLYDVETRQLTRFQKLPFGNLPLSGISWRPTQNHEFTTVLHGVTVHVDARDSKIPWQVKEPNYLRPCSIDWHQGGDYFARGSENQVQVYDIRKLESEQLIYHGQQFRAGVKALKWNPYNQSNLLMAGAGAADGGLYLLNPLRESKQICRIDVGAQICGLSWLDSSHVLVGGGRETKEKLSLWKCSPNQQTLTKIKAINLAGKRVLNVVKDPFTNQYCTHSEEEILAWEATQIAPSNRKRKLQEFSIR